MLTFLAKNPKNCLLKMGLFIHFYRFFDNFADFSEIGPEILNYCSFFADIKFLIFLFQLTTFFTKNKFAQQFSNENQT